jgi:hypothetical protein
MEDTFGQNNISRRKVLTAFGIAGFSAASGTALAAGNMELPDKKAKYASYGSIDEMVGDRTLKEGDIVQAFGYYKAGDGGAASYTITKPAGPAIDLATSGIQVNNGLVAALINVQSINYKMFGAVGDGKNDDGVQIRTAHAYANHTNIPVVNLHGEYWLQKPNDIEIQTNVSWGSTVFHIDERNNSAGNSRFRISSALKKTTIELDAGQKAGLLEKLRPGLKLLPELAAYKNCLISISDKNDQIGFRSGKSAGQSWAKEELFYVEEHGSIIGDIAWVFKDYTSLVAYPAEDHYLTVDGGTFYLSGDSNGKTYVRCGFAVTRSRSIIQNQWVGLEPGKADVSNGPRSGFYTFSNVYDVKLENVRLIPFEQDREGTANDVPQGTYGISAARVLNGLFRNVTAEGGPAHWGVFGTNLNKNFRVENCRLNRIDVHFHCWNLYIKDSSIGYRGISVTGGGDLFIENTSCYSRSFINFRKDFGAKWDGNIRLRNCRFIPAVAADTALLDFSPMDFEYKYPLGFGRSVIVENLLVDFSAVPASTAACWLMKIAAFSKTKEGHRLFFPSYIEFRNVIVQGREKGVRLLEITDPQHYHLGVPGGYDGTYLTANSSMVFDQVQLENLEDPEPAKTAAAHLSINNTKQDKYEDQYALYPEIRLLNCKNVVANLGGNVADLSLERCSVVAITGNEKGALPGRFSFSDCSFRPAVKEGKKDFYVLSSILGTSFTNCTLHAPKINGTVKPELTDLNGFVHINKLVRYNHLNTRLGNDVINYYKSKGIVFNKQFISMLKSHHQMEDEKIG